MSRVFVYIIASTCLCLHKSHVERYKRYLRISYCLATNCHVTCHVIVAIEKVSHSCNREDFT